MSIDLFRNQIKTDFKTKGYLTKAQQFIDLELGRTFPAMIEAPSLLEAMNYSLRAGGKRIRPILCLATAEACGGSWQRVLPIALALEMIHTFSLIHDDLPAMDDDNFRRGIPTNHRVHGEALAILAGDALLAEAFQVLITGLKHEEPRAVLEVVREVARATGMRGMVGGQALDMAAEGREISLQALQNLHRLKTGCLLEVSVTSGARIMTQDESLLDYLSRYGRAIGLAFQIIDDVLDVEGGADLGKDVGSDAGRGKSTYVKALGLEGSKREALHQIEEAFAALSPFGVEADPLRAIALYIVERNK